MRAEGGGGYEVLGLPARAMTIRNSARVLAACPRRWFFDRAEGLEPLVEARPLSYGLTWHAALEDVHRWWMATRGEPFPDEGGEVCTACRATGDPRCRSCAGTRLGPVARARAAWRDTDREDDVVVLERNLEGWLHVHGRVPPDGHRVVGVELALAVPVASVASGSSSVYAPEVYVVRRADGTERLARTGEAVDGARLPPGATLLRERREVWLSVRLDALLANEYGALVVDEHKSSADPEGYVAGLSVDPQVTCYEVALEHAVSRGLLEMPTRDCAGGVAVGTTVSGWLYDVASSRKLRDPVELKLKKGQTVPELSTAKNKLASVPSWRLQAAWDRLGIPTDFDALSHQRSCVDRKRFVREWGASPPEKKRETRLELYAEARRQVSLHRSAATMSQAEAVAVLFPRVPVCRQPGGRCVYREPCYADTPQARSGFTVRHGDAERGEADSYDAEADVIDARDEE